MRSTAGDGSQRSSLPNSAGDNFPKTAEDMLVDSRTLHAAGRYRNACYLAGYVVESMLKTLIEAASRRHVKPTHDLSSLREQILALSLSAGQMIAKYGDPMQFARTMITGVANEDRQIEERRFCDWDPFHRYNGSRWDDAAKSSAYLQEAERAVAILNELLLDGGLR